MFIQERRRKPPFFPDSTSRPPRFVPPLTSFSLFPEAAILRLRPANKSIPLSSGAVHQQGYTLDMICPFPFTSCDPSGVRDHIILLVPALPDVIFYEGDLRGTYLLENGQGLTEILHGSGVIATLIENCKLSGTNPHIWLTDTLARLANGHPANAVGELMPWTAVA